MLDNAQLRSVLFHVVGCVCTLIFNSLAKVINWLE